MLVLISKISLKSILKTIKTVYYILLVSIIYQHAFIVPYLNIDFDVTVPLGRYRALLFLLQACAYLSDLSRIKDHCVGSLKYARHKNPYGEWLFI